MLILVKAQQLIYRAVNNWKFLVMFAAPNGSGPEPEARISPSIFIYKRRFNHETIL